ncbi:hypothetical protein C8R48DRAFT_679459 [Suillus tomentosus]|nr:hypothetical protein C8R48DRAFT_679459 [Suillus tomentosus]
MPAYWSKWESLFGSARFLTTTFLNFLSVRTTTMGTGEFEKRSFDKLPKPGAPNATSQACIVPRWSLMITTVESGADSFIDYQHLWLAPRAQPNIFGSTLWDRSLHWLVNVSQRILTEDHTLILNPDTPEDNTDGSAFNTLVLLDLVPLLPEPSAAYAASFGAR